jgi:hypothetical protein
VAVTRETILRFTKPLAPGIPVGADRLFAEFGGQRLPARIHTSPDGRTITLFYQQTLPAAARIRVTLIADGLLDDRGRGIDADGDEQAGGTKVIDFDTLALATLPGTAVIGRVFASEPGDGGVNAPLAGVTITVDGLETTLRAVTDAAGNFRLEPAPAGAFFVHIDGHTATNQAPVGGYYPVVGKKWEARAGAVTDVGNVYLPLVVPGTLQPVSRTQDTAITFPPSVLAGHPELAGVEIVVPADALYSDNGARGGMVGIAPVPPDRIPSPLPPGLDFPVVITVQTDGGTNFDRPVPVCFPNLPDGRTGQKPAAGSKSALWSFNHDIGDWEIVGPMTVTADGRLVCSDAGVGIRAPGWHGARSGSEIVVTPKDPTDCAPTEVMKAVAGVLKHAAGIAVDLVPGLKVPKCLLGLAQALAKQADDAAAILAQDHLNCVVAGSLKLLAEGIAAVVKNCVPAGNLAGRLKKVKDACNALSNGLGFLENASALAACFDNATPATLDFAADVFKGIKDVSGLVCDMAERLNNMIDAELQFVTVGAKVAAAIEKLGCEENRSLAEAASANELPLDPDLRAALVEYEATARALIAALGSMSIAEVDQTSATAQHVLMQTRLLGERLVPNVLRTPPNPVYVVATLGNGQVLRDSIRGTSRVRLPSETDVEITAFDPVTGRLASVAGVTGPSGSTTYLGELVLEEQPESTDTDNDGLSDQSEFVIGTNRLQGDTDGDGIDDGAEVQQGTDPLDGLPARTGILATADTPGTAINVAARNDLAVVADSTGGVSIFNVAAGSTPVLIGRWTRRASPSRSPSRTRWSPWPTGRAASRSWTSATLPPP